MVIPHSHSQPLLGRHHADDDNERDPSVARDSSSDGSRLPSGSALRMHSCQDMLLGGIRRGGGGDADAYFKRCQTAPGYVSFEDVIGTKEFREGSGRQPEAGISDPLVRTASRLYSLAHPRHRRRSPGPLGTRRGSAMHRFVKKYVSPCVAFVAGVFCCVPGVATP